LIRGKDLNLIKKKLIGIQMSCGDSSSTSTVLSILTSEVSEDICGIGNNLEDEVATIFHCYLGRSHKTGLTAFA
jgi:hypothetical protein